MGNSPAFRWSEITVNPCRSQEGWRCSWIFYVIIQIYVITSFFDFVYEVQKDLQKVSARIGISIKSTEDLFPAFNIKVSEGNFELARYCPRHSPGKCDERTWKLLFYGVVNQPRR